MRNKQPIYYFMEIASFLKFRTLHAVKRLHSRTDKTLPFHFARQYTVKRFAIFPPPTLIVPGQGEFGK
jgi:hypothetical protein